MVPGDRIAIKKMLGQGSPDIEIRAIEIIKDIDNEDKCVYVDWLLRDMNRKVSSKGAYKLVHGPCTSDAQWLKEVFYI